MSVKCKEFSATLKFLLDKSAAAIP